MKGNKKIYLYIILLTVGVIISVVSLINIIKPEAKYVEYTEEEIKTKARELGMVDLKEIIKVNSDSNEDINENIEKEEEIPEKQKTEKENEGEKEESLEEEKNTDYEETTKNQDKAETISKDNQNIKFTIEKGERSEKIISRLYEMGIIDDEKEFTEVVRKNNAGRLIVYGTYELQKNMEYERVLEIITGRKF